MKLRISLFMIIIFFTTNFIFAQSLTLPRTSPKAKVFQEIGVTGVTIEYSRPAVKEREIWGSLVPYGLNKGRNEFPAPWRAGANENTTIDFSTDVKINGKILAKGKYGLFIETGENEWKVIFNKVNTAWGNYFYEPSKNALIVSINPEDNFFTEWLEFSFENIKPNSSDVVFKWEKIKAAFTVEVDLVQTTLEDIRAQLVTTKGFNQQPYVQAVNFCLKNNVNYEEALKWINKSISIEENFMNLTLKTMVLSALGKESEIGEINKRINSLLEISSESEINQYGYSLKNLGKIDKSVEVFEFNMKKFPNSWNAYDSYADLMEVKGEKEKAKEFYNKALELAPENQKERLKKIISEF